VGSASPAILVISLPYARRSRAGCQLCDCSFTGGSDERGAELLERIERTAAERAAGNLRDDIALLALRLTDQDPRTRASIGSWQSGTTCAWACATKRMRWW
jgi:hypothetical protein